MNIEDSKTIISLPIPSELLWIVWLVLLVTFIVTSWILNRHWNLYGIKGNKKIFAKSLYFVGGIGLLVLLALLIGSYSIMK